ncbi:MAG: hypothetical protein KDA28_16535, partial [Phycisphaerales bacterium]|nr:hypothetical protein [Phycisphaerales bacterium]
MPDETAERVHTTRHRAAERDVAHDEAVERRPRVRPGEHRSHLVAGDEAPALEDVPSLPFGFGPFAQQLEPIGRRFGHRGQTLACQDDLDLIAVRLVDAAKHEQGLVDRIRLVPLQELRHDLVR